MDAVQALTVTALGIAVTFLGLSLTSLLIVALSAIPKVRLGRHVPPRTPAPAVGPAVPADVVSVIATVVEIERRLYHAAPRRPAVGAAARDSARREGEP